MSDPTKIEIMIAITLMVTLAMLWYFFWIKPHDEMLYWMMECAGGDDSQEVWKACHEKFLIHKGVSVD